MLWPSVRRPGWLRVNAETLSSGFPTPSQPHPVRPGAAPRPSCGREQSAGLEDRRAERIRTVSEVADEYFEQYKVRHRSTTFAEYALKHVKRLVGKTLIADVSDATVKDYQTARLKEKAAPKAINEEVGFLLRIVEDRGDAIRAKMRRQKTLKLKGSKSISKAFTVEQKAALLAAAKRRRSPAIYPALMLALNAGMRDKELRGLQGAALTSKTPSLRLASPRPKLARGAPFR